MTTGSSITRYAATGAMARVSAMSLDQSDLIDPMARKAIAMTSTDLVKPNDIANSNATTPTPALIFATASRGRRQTSAIMSTLGRLSDADMDRLKARAAQWLIGLDASSEAPKAACQDILKRLAMALDGPAQAISTQLFTKEDVATLPCFPPQVP